MRRGVAEGAHPAGRGALQQGEQRPWYLGISVGCAAFVYNQASQLSEELELADQQLYQAKALRRSSVIRTRERGITS